MEMPEYCVERAGRILNRFKKALNGSRVLLLGVAYKQDIDDYRESPALKVIKYLEENGALVSYYDPYVKEIKWCGGKRERHPFFDARKFRSQLILLL